VTTFWYNTNQYTVEPWAYQHFKYRCQFDCGEFWALFY